MYDTCLAQIRSIGPCQGSIKSNEQTFYQFLGKLTEKSSRNPSRRLQTLPSRTRARAVGAGAPAALRK